MARMLQPAELGQLGQVRTMRMEFVFGDAVIDGAAAFSMDALPAGTHIRGFNITVKTGEEFDSGTSDALEIGDGTDPNAFVTTEDIQSAFNAEGTAGVFATPGYVLEVATTPTLTYTQAGTVPTAGKCWVDCVYVPMSVQ